MLTATSTTTFDNPHGADITPRSERFEHAPAKLTLKNTVIGGNFTSYNGSNRNRIARVNANGSLDNTFNVGT